MQKDKYNISVNGKAKFSLHESDAASLDLVEATEGEFHLLKDGTSYRANVEGVDLETKTVSLLVNGNRFQVRIADPFDQLVEKMGLSKVATQKINEIKAPMPGLVLSVSVTPGQSVAKGDALLILEAMKMENVIKAPVDCVVQSILAAKGKAVDKGEVLVVIE